MSAREGSKGVGGKEGQQQQQGKDNAEKDLYRFLNPDKPKAVVPAGPDPALVLQSLVFRRWVDHQLTGELRPDPKATLEDFVKDGKKLQALASKLSGKCVEDNPMKMTSMHAAQLQAVRKAAASGANDNTMAIILALNLFAQDGVSGTLNITPQELEEGKLSSITTFFYSVILRYQLPVGTDTLLKWCIENSVPHIEVIMNNFKDSWTNGLALLSMLAKLKPGRVSLQNRTKESAQENLALALEVAEKELGIPRLVQVEEFLSPALSERVVVTLLGFFYTSFGPPSVERGLRRQLLELESAVKDRDQQIKKREELLVHKAQELGAKIEEKSKELAEAGDKMKELEQLLQDKEAKFEKTKQELEGLLNATDAEKRLLQETLGDTVRRKEAHIQSLTAQMEELRAVCNDKDAMLMRSAAELKFLVASHKEVQTQLNEARGRNQEVLRKMTELSLRMPFYTGKTTTGEIPKGSVTILSSEVQGADELWRKVPNSMARALREHNELLLVLAKSFEGFIVRMESGSFTIAFVDPLQAARFALKAQQALTEVQWPAELLSEPEASVVKGPDGELLFSGLRVRMVVHHAEPVIHEDPASGKSFYVGPVMNLISGLLDTTPGGSLVFTTAAWKLIAERLNNEPVKVQSTELADKVKSGEDELGIVQVLPVPLHLRQFDASAVGQTRNREEDPAAVLEGQLSNLKGENEALKGALSEMEQKAIEAEKKAAELQKALEEALKGIAKNPQLELELAAREIGHLINAQEKLKAEVGDANKKNEETTKLIDALNQELQVVSMDQRLVGKQLIELKEQNQSARGQIDSLKGENEELHRRIEELLKEPKKKGIIRRLLGTGDDKEKK